MDNKRVDEELKKIGIALLFLLVLYPVLLYICAG